jgi:hypothetical protein
MEGIVHLVLIVKLRPPIIHGLQRLRENGSLDHFVVYALLQKKSLVLLSPLRQLPSPTLFSKLSVVSNSDSSMPSYNGVSLSTFFFRLHDDEKSSSFSIACTHTHCITSRDGHERRPTAPILSASAFATATSIWAKRRARSIVRSRRGISRTTTTIAATPPSIARK